MRAADDPEAWAVGDRSMDHRVPVDGREYLRQVDIECEIVPDELRVSAGEREEVSFLGDADQVPAHDPHPCIPLSLPAKDLAAREGEVEIERLAWFENKGSHVRLFSWIYLG